jgi:alkanesulfonate monooxygenase SsuD/methylene tetrahydromethanopterin reductase-like flavin-dependent oxidoreductase (luciferase family)
MRLAVMLEPQLGLTYQTQLEVARQAERLGFDALFRSDHYGADRGADEPGSTDAWAVLAGLVRETATIKVGVLVTPVTFRPAANLAKLAATVAEMAGARGPVARLEVGLGTGWMASEHRAHGFPFEDLDTRFRRLEEHLQIVRGLWDPGGEPFAFAGAFEELEAAYFRPKPDPPPRLLVGGKGPARTPALAARYADEWNTVSASPARCAELRAALDQACARERREPLPLSLMVPVIVGRSADAVAGRAARVAAALGSGEDPEDLLARVGAAGLVGTPAAVRARADDYAGAGVDRIMLQHLLVDDAEQLELIAAEVLPHLAGA